MLPYENEVQKATKIYMIILNIAFAALLLHAFIVAATFFSINQQMMGMSFDNSMLTGSPTYIFLAALVPGTIAYIFLRVVIQNYGENLRQSYILAKTETPVELETE